MEAKLISTRELVEVEIHSKEQGLWRNINKYEFYETKELDFIDKEQRRFEIAKSSTLAACKSLEYENSPINAYAISKRSVEIADTIISMLKYKK